MSIKDILFEARNRELTVEESICLLSEVNDINSINELMKTAKYVTDKKFSQELILHSRISPNFKCINNPSCLYCGNKCVEKEEMSIEEFKLVMDRIKKEKIRHIEFGETTYKEDGSEVLPYLKIIRNSKKIDELWINVGQNLSVKALEKFKEYGVTGIGSSFEVIGDKSFLKYRKGDNLRSRWNHLNKIKELEMKFFNYLMVGSGETEIEKMEYFNKLKESNIDLSLILVPWNGKSGLFEVIKTGCVCRLFCNSWNIDIGGKNNIELNILAGGNMVTMGGVCVKKEMELSKKCENSIKLQRGYINFYNYHEILQKYLDKYGVNIII